MGNEESTLVAESVRPQTLTERSLAAVAAYLKDESKKRKVVVLTGAGISTAAGIPDFRSPKTGLYNNLARLNLPYAEAVFDISYFRSHPEPFYVLAQELYPGKFHPTVSHAFIKLLDTKGMLQMLFTQNIDCLERRVGVPADKIVEAHGSFATQRCIECKVEFPDHLMREHVARGEVPRCQEGGCTGTVKPDIVFFGEMLPSAFGENAGQARTADLVLILGTSLTVHPFAGLPELVAEGKPRVLFNMERVGRLGTRPDDVMELGSCDEGIRKLADELGWRDELEACWREVVGHEEADRQLGSARRGEQEVEDEVQKLTEGVQEALRLCESEDEAGPLTQQGVEKTQTMGNEDHEAVVSGEPTAAKGEHSMARAQSSKEAPGSPVEQDVAQAAAEAAGPERVNEKEKEKEVGKPSL
ncbi:NAD-dependent deacetylase sirtuin-2 [Metarhizium acridum CQMa 102]|uniref:NAD-dependent deacetylase sirtuin-2 n=1 Tax=Metarhizium acridum (strain CQMa 102) TaxID=655827 RepID=E9EAJ3_METAQ|nr:NAD-dependent deacetylase sirtuin-2 [Metarhizium acridum CQMa 102]EFY87102.1 NAD-dependent deacetylase sirtuin-2 [Metarhizium acridum CQMa 102]